MHVTFFSYLKSRPPLATDNLPDQTKQHIASRQCDEVPGQRASANSRNPRRPLRSARMTRQVVIPTVTRIVGTVARVVT
jgi:hypothetical protein